MARNFRLNCATPAFRSASSPPPPSGAGLLRSSSLVAGFGSIVAVGFYLAALGLLAALCAALMRSPQARWHDYAL